MEVFESMKANVVIFNKLKGKRECYFVTKKNSNSLIISDKSLTKLNTVTSPKWKSSSTPDELSIINHANYKKPKKTQPSKTPSPLTPETPTYKTKVVSRIHLFSDDLFLQEEITFLRKELYNYQRIIETLVQQILEDVRLIHQAENTNF